MRSKTLILFTLCFLCLSIDGFSSGKTDRKDSLTVVKLKNKIDSIQKISKGCLGCFADTTRKSGYLFKENGKFIYSARTFNFGHWTLIFLPLVLYGFILFYVLAQLQRSKFSLADALSENFTITVSVPNPVTAAGAAPTIPSDVQPRSISRLIAFLSGLAALSIGVCATSYYFYIYLKTGTSPNLDNLFNILLGLGIGVVPYAFNRVSAAFTGSR